MALLDKLQTALFFEQGEGLIAYDSIGANPGTLSDEALWTSSGKIGGGIANAGAARHIALTALTLPSTGSMAVQFKTASTSRQSILSTAAGIVGLYFDANYQPGVGGSSPGKIGFTIENPTSTTLSFYADVGSDLSDGDHHLIVVTWAAATSAASKVYFDGALETTTSVSAGLVTTSEKDCVIGAGRNPSGGLHNYLNGGLDALMVFNDILTADEVTELYNAGDGLQPYKSVAGYAAYTLVNARLVRVG